MKNGVYRSDVAASIPFDNTIEAQLTATDVQGAIDELSSTAAVSASPGFTWGRSGNSSSGSYLQNDTVPSNISGRLVPLVSGNIEKIFFTNENVTTCNLTVQKRSGASFVDLVTVNIVASRKGVFTVSTPVVLNDELAVKITSGSAKNIVVGLLIKGSTS